MKNKANKSFHQTHDIYLAPALELLSYILIQRHISDKRGSLTTSLIKLRVINITGRNKPAIVAGVIMPLEKKWINI